jgi:phage shock protein PspC (stress-responsive transcriptional regulator)
MKEILRKLSSRKLWLAIAGVATGIAMALGVEATDVSTVAGAVTALVSVVTYIITEGKVDAESVKNAIEITSDALDLFETKKEGE